VSGNSPEGKQTRSGPPGRSGRSGPRVGSIPEGAAIMDIDDDEGAEPPLARRTLADLMSSEHMRPNSASGFRINNALTPLAAAAESSDPTRLHALEGKVESLTTKLADALSAKVHADAAREIAEHARTAADAEVVKLTAQLSVAQTKVGTLEQSLAEAQRSIDVARASENDLREQRAIWSSLFMANQKVDCGAFSSLMAAQMDRGSSSKDAQ